MRVIEIELECQHTLIEWEYGGNSVVMKMVIINILYIVDWAVNIMAGVILTVQWMKWIYI